jgi:hypothetical protein
VQSILWPSICKRYIYGILLTKRFSIAPPNRRFAAPPKQEIGCGAVSEIYMQFFVVDGTDRFGRAIVDV